MTHVKQLLASLLLLSLIACGSSRSSSSSEHGDMPNDDPMPRQIAVTEVNDGAITLRWESTEDAESYYLYYASEPIVDVENIHAHQDGDWLTDVSSPFTVTGLTNNTTYYFLITTVVNGTESSPGYSVNATPVSAPIGPQPTAEEVRVIELINRARRNPQAEVDRNPQINHLNEGIEPEAITTEQKQPLAFNPMLMVAARAHSEWMLEANTFSHTGVDGSTPQQRIAQSGYAPIDATGENISVSGSTTLNTTQVIETQHEQLFASPGHRTTMLADMFREVGTGRELGDYTFEQGTLPSSMLTQKYALNRGQLFITGVVYADNNGNATYDVGEGMENVVITINGSAHRATQSGLYAVTVVGNTVHQVSVSGGDLPEPLSTEVEVLDRNIKLDVYLADSKIHTDIW